MAGEEWVKIGPACVSSHLAISLGEVKGCRGILCSYEIWASEVMSLTCRLPYHVLVSPAEFSLNLGFLGTSWIMHSIG